jgi:hypothetical protein
MEHKDDYYVRLPARVLACLNDGEITILLSPQPEVFAEPGIVEVYPIDWLPIDLRTPNSEFDVVIKFPDGVRVKFLRKDEAWNDLDVLDDA